MSRLDRRKARTRQALIRTRAVRLIAEGRGDRASIQEITERDVLSTYAGGPARRGVRVWQSQRNSPEMRLTEPATMTTPNT